MSTFNITPSVAERTNLLARELEQYEDILLVKLIFGASKMAKVETFIKLYAVLIVFLIRT